MTPAKKRRTASASPSVLVLRHARHEGPGTIASFLKTAGVEHRCLDVFKTPAFPSLDSVSGLVVMGGPMGVYETSRFSFLVRELAFLRKAIAAGKPVLGVCLGAQLIAHALGARVYPHTVKEIGWGKIRLTSAGKKDPWMKPASRFPWVFQWHGDTFDLPRGARRLATSALCKNQAFRYGAHVYGLQYHIELDGPMIRNWLTQPGAAKDLAAVGPRTRRDILDGLPTRLPGLQRLARPFVAGFARAIR